MENWQLLLLGAAGVLLLAAVCCSAVRKSKARRERDFTRKLETLLQPKEIIKVICPQKRGHCILTGSRIIFEEKGEFTAFPLKSLQRVQGKNKEGNRTTVPAKMVSLTIHLEKEYTLRNTGPAFEELTGLLQEKVKKQQEKKKAGREKRQKADT